MALALPLLFVPESGLKVPIVLWCSLCQGHETEAIPADSRPHPLELSLGWGASWCRSLVPLEWGMWRRPASQTGCLLFHLSAT